jgi:hypothetical protein
MKLNGKRPGVHVHTIVLPRDDEDLVLRARAIDDFEPFKKLCPEPAPPFKQLPGGEKVHDVTDSGYLQRLTSHSGKRIAYMVIKGLSDGTPNLEWENVDLSDHTTWEKYTEELRESGFSDIEIGRIVKGVMVANSLSEDAIEEARQRLLASERDLDEN